MWTKSARRLFHTVRSPNLSWYLEEQSRRRERARERVPCALARRTRESCIASASDSRVPRFRVLMFTSVELFTLYSYRGSQVCSAVADLYLEKLNDQSKAFSEAARQWSREERLPCSSAPVSVRFPEVKLFCNFREHSQVIHTCHVSRCVELSPRRVQMDTQTSGTTLHSTFTYTQPSCTDRTAVRFFCLTAEAPLAGVSLDTIIDVTCKSRSLNARLCSTTSVESDAVVRYSMIAMEACV